MTQATDLLSASRAPHWRIVGVISAAHFVSHYYILILAPLLPFIRAEYNVSYTQIGFTLAAFNIVSALLQTPAGFLVDRFGARVLLIAGLSIGALAFVMAGLIDSFWVLVAMFALAGVGNTVYHPADYALLSQHVPADRIGQAFSVHTFAGMLGSAAAPASLLLMQDLWGWRGAFIGAGLFGLAVAAVLALIPSHPIGPAKLAPRVDADGDATGWRLLMTGPILLNFVFFTLIAVASAGLYTYSVVALGALHGTAVGTANIALSSFLLLAAIGVLVGGIVASRTIRHGLVARLGLFTLAMFAILFASVDLGSLPLIAAMTVCGFFYGVIMPSRDMIVREVTPPGSFGKVFGFVTTGFNIGGIIAPLLFGAILDHGSPALVFLAVAAVCLIAILTVASRGRPTG